MTDITGARILVTGVTAELAKPVAAMFAKDNEVFGAARFKDPAVREAIEALGVKPVRLDLAKGELDDLPETVDYVVHFAVTRTHKWDTDLDAQVSGLLYLYERFQNAKAFLHCSSTAVYFPDGHNALSEDAPLGDSHRPMFMPTYSIAKIAAEGAARHGAKRYNLPTTIARLNVPYGDTGGWPFFHLLMMEGGAEIGVTADAPSEYHPIHFDDIVATVPKLLAVAGVPPTTVNWGGDEKVSVEEWTAYLGELTGLEPKLAVSPHSLESVVLNLDRMHELIGHTEVKWKDGFRRMVAAAKPELLKPAP